MRLAGAAAGLLVLLTAAATFAQPTSPTPGWRTAASAALAFGHAEGKMEALRRFAITSAPQTKQAADAALEDLDRRAQRARDAYLSVQRYGSPFWSAAAEIRMGDTFMCQGDKIIAIPIPPPVAAAAQRLQQPTILSEYLAFLHELSAPLRNQATRVWERVAGEENVPEFVVRRARERLAGTSLPDC